MSSCIINLLVDVHLWPAVPIAPNTEAVTAILRSALFDIIIALFPPSYNKTLPNLLPTVSATIFPILVEPVA